MTVQTNTNVASFNGNGVTQIFPIAFKFNNDTDLVVLLVDDDTGSASQLTLNSDYTVSGEGDEEGGLINVVVAPASGQRLKVTRVVDILQLTDLRNQGKFFAEVHEDAFDLLTMIAQQHQSDIALSLRVAETDPEPARIPSVARRAGKLLAFDADGNPTTALPVADSSTELRQDLANGQSALVDSAVVGWRGRTVADRLNDTANVKDYGAIADGTLHPLSERFATLAAAQAVYPHVTALTQSIDWAAAQAALNSGSPRVHFPGQRYVFNDDLSRNSSVMLVGDGTTVLEFTDGKRMALAGSLSALPALSANVTTLSRSLTFTSAPGLSSGDVVLAYNPTDYSWSPHRAYYRQGEFFRVHTVSESTANIFGLPAEDYAASAMQMYKVNGIRVAMQDLIIVGAASTVGAIVQIRFGVNVSLTNVDAYGGSSYAIEIDRCYQVDVLCGGGRNNSPYDDDEYGLVISNCQRVTITGGDHAATRHAIALGGGNDTGAVPCRDIFINNMSLICAAADIGAADMHGNVERVTYSNCHITHANIAGRNVTLRGCTIYQRTSPSDGAAVFGSEIVGGTFLIEDCVLITAGDLGAFGAITLSMTHTLKEKLNLVVRGLIVKGGAGGELAKLVKVSVANGETRKCNVDIRGVRCELAQAQSVLYIRCDGNTDQVVMSDGHIVDDIYGPSGMYLIFPSGSALDGIPTRQMEQAGEAVITTANTAAFALPAPIKFRYPYSKRPTAGVVASGSDGAAFSTLGGAAPVPVIYTLTSTAIRPAVVAPSGTFTNDVSALIHWRSVIKEI